MITRGADDFNNLILMANLRDNRLMPSVLPRFPSAIHKDIPEAQGMADLHRDHVGPHARIFAHPIGMLCAA